MLTEQTRLAIALRRRGSIARPTGARPVRRRRPCGLDRDLASTRGRASPRAELVRKIEPAVARKPRKFRRSIPLHRRATGIKVTGFAGRRRTWRGLRNTLDMKMMRTRMATLGAAAFAVAAIASSPLCAQDPGPGHVVQGEGGLITALVLDPSSSGNDLRDDRTRSLQDDRRRPHLDGAGRWSRQALGARARGRSGVARQPLRRDRHGRRLPFRRRRRRVERGQLRARDPLDRRRGVRPEDPRPGLRGHRGGTPLPQHRRRPRVVRAQDAVPPGLGQHDHDRSDGLQPDLRRNEQRGHLPDLRRRTDVGAADGSPEARDHLEHHGQPRLARPSCTPAPTTGSSRARTAG